MTLFRGLISGPPGSGKTASLAALANAGYRIIRCAFEPGEEVFKAYCTDEGRARIFNVPFEDEWEVEDEGLIRVAHGMQRFEHFIFNGKVGKEQPFGSPKEWGADTVVVIDTLTMMSTCCEAREEKLLPGNNMLSMYEAGRQEESAAQFMTGAKRGYHTIWLAHLKLISPKAESGFKNETELQKQVKRERAQLEDTGYFPTASTGGIARNFTSHFPFALIAEENERAKNDSGRVFRTKKLTGYQIKCPLDVPDMLPIENGLLTIFKKLEG